MNSVKDFYDFAKKKNETAKDYKAVYADYSLDQLLARATEIQEEYEYISSNYSIPPSKIDSTIAPLIISWLEAELDAITELVSLKKNTENEKEVSKDQLEKIKAELAEMFEKNKEKLIEPKNPKPGYEYAQSEEPKGFRL